MKKFLTAIVLILVALVAISFFLPKDMNLAVTKQLEAAPEQVFVQINNLKNWENWSPWHDMDPNMELTYAEDYIGEGGSYTWKSDKQGVGNGAAIIEESVPNEKVVTILKFEGYEDDDTRSAYLIEPTDAGSEVTWTFQSEHKAKWPWAIYWNAMMRSMIKKSYAKGLGNIDAYIKENPEAHLEALEDEGGSGEIAVTVTEVEPFQGVTVKRSGNIADMETNGDEIYGQALGEVMGKIEEDGLTPAGMPFAVGLNWDEEAGTYDILIGMPVAEGGETYGGGKVVRADFYGYYDGVGAAHLAADEYIAANSLEVRGAPWEVYVTDPGMEPDTAKWLTEVYYPVN